MLRLKAGLKDCWGWYHSGRFLQWPLYQVKRESHGNGLGLRCLSEDPDIGRDDGEVVMITGLHDSTCRGGSRGRNLSGEAVGMMAVQIAQPICLERVGQELLTGERPEPKNGWVTAQE